MSGNTVWSYVIGAVVGIVIAFATAGTGLAAYSTLLGTMAFGISTAVSMYYLNKPGGGAGGSNMLNKSGGGSVKNAAAQDFDIGSASEAVTIAVVFGSVRLPPNVLRYDTSTFRSEPIIEKYEISSPVIVTQQASGGGGKGGGGGGDSGGGSGSKADEQEKKYVEQIVGYNYYISMDLGLCCGPIDRVDAIYDATDQRKVGTGGAFSGESRVVSVKGKDSGGSIRVYRGSATQTRVPGEHYSAANSNYRHVCFAHMQNFHIGTQPVPRTYLFNVVRWPVCLGEDGLPVPGLKVRGSADSGNASYYDANPAAILFEMFTNKVWGRGLDPKFMDIPSFVAASEYFETQNLGLSFSLESQEVVSGTVDMVRNHVSTIVVWDGQRVSCTVTMDPGTAYTLAATITSESVSKIEFSRPAVTKSTNELRVEFTNRANAFKSEIAIVQDDASFQTVGLINSTHIVLNGFSQRKVAELQALRLLGELAVPRASLSFYSNRWNSLLGPGKLVRFVFSEWSSGQDVTFWRVAEINDAGQSQDGIKITLSEDLYLSPYSGEVEDFGPPVPPFEGAEVNDDDDLNQGEDHNAPFDIGDMAPVQVFELNPFLSGGDPDFIITARQSSPLINLMINYWSPDPGTDYTSHSATSGWAVQGELSGALDDKGGIFRNAEKEFLLALDDTNDEATMLASANKVQLDSDHMQVLTGAGSDLLVVGNEIIQCGLIEEVGANSYRVRNYIRGAFGSEVEAHASGAKFSFIPQWQRVRYATTLKDIPRGEPVKLRSHAITIQGEDTTDFDYFGPEVDHSFLGRGERPYAPAVLVASRVVNDWSVELRPRFYDRGAGLQAGNDDSHNTLVTTLPEGYAIFVEPYLSGTPNGDVALMTTAAFSPDDGTGASGRVAFTWTAPAGTNELRIRQAIGSKQSLAYALASA